MQLPQIKPTYWILIVLAVLGFVVLGTYLNGNKGNKADKLTRKQEKAMHANIGKQHERARQDSIAAAKALAAANELRASAARSQAAADRLTKEALLIHHKSRAHATPVPTTTAGLADLQRYFATYGDSTANLR